MDPSETSDAVRTDERTKVRARSVGTRIGAGGKTGIDVTHPPYAIPNDSVPFEGICDWSISDSRKMKAGIPTQLPYAMGSHLVVGESHRR